MGEQVTIARPVPPWLQTYRAGLQAGSHGIRLAREEGILPLGQTSAIGQEGMRCPKINASAKAEATAMSRVNAKTR